MIPMPLRLRWLRRRYALLRVRLLVLDAELAQAQRVLAAVRGLLS